MMILEALLAAAGQGGGVPPTAVTWNPADKFTILVLSGGDLVGSYPTAEGSFKSVRATLGRSAGKYYFNVTNDAAKIMVGIMTGATSIAGGHYVGSDATGYGYWENGQKFHAGSGAGFGTPVAPGDKVTVAVDLDAAKLWWAKNGTWQGSGDPAAGTNAAYSITAGTYFPATSLYNPDGSGQFTGKFTADAYGPAGFSPWES